MELNYILLGSRLKKARTAKKLSQDKLSELCDISPQHLSQIESGKTKLSLPCLVRICNALKITADYVLMDSVNCFTPQVMAEVAAVYADCTPHEIFFMLSISENLKKSMRIKNICVDSK
jgi:transcriptional regulator with XRE-family HTH domain